MKKSLDPLDAFLNKPWVLAIASVGIAVLTFLIFSAFIDRKPSEYASEIIAAFLGTALTVVITALLLRHQTAHITEAEEKKEKNLAEFRAKLEKDARIADDARAQKWENKTKIYEVKIKTYTDLMNEIERIVLGKQEENEDKKDVTETDAIRLQILFQKMAFVAGPDVMKKLSDFAEEFSEAAYNGSISKRERQEILQAFGKLTVAIRSDLNAQMGEDAPNTQEAKELEDIITKDLNYVSSKTKTTESAFLSSCTPEEKAYYDEVLGHLKNVGIHIEPQTKGLSIRDKKGKSIAQFYPSGSRKSIVIILDDVVEKSDEINAMLKSHGINGCGFKPAELPVTSLVEIIKILATQ